MKSAFNNVAIWCAVIATLSMPASYWVALGKERELTPTAETIDYIRELQKRHSISTLSVVMVQHLPLEHLFTLERISDKLDAGNSNTKAERGEEFLIFFYPSKSRYLTDQRLRALSQFPNIFAYEVDVEAPRCIVVNTGLHINGGKRADSRRTVTHFEFHDRNYTSDRNLKCWRVVERSNIKG